MKPLPLIRLLLLILLPTALWSCSDEADTAASSKVQTVTLNVDVIAPANIYSQWSNAVHMALDNLQRAQVSQRKQVKINLRFHDEDTENLEQLAYALTHPKEGADSCHAIIGPYHSDNARTILNYAAASRLPVIMPTCTGGELQRIETRSTNSWFLTESDISQCEVMLSMCHTLGSNQVALLYGKGTYGDTFNKWFAYYATEYRIRIANGGVQQYTDREALRTYLKQLRQPGSDTYLCLALASDQDYLDVMQEIGEPYDAATNSYINIVCTDMATTERVLQSAYSFTALQPVASPASGFSSIYQSRFGRFAYNGEAQIYDALCLLAYGAAKRMWADNPNYLEIDGKPVEYDYKPYGPTLTDWMRAAVADAEGTCTDWTAQGMASAFQSYAKQEHCALSGAMGALEFDATSHTKILNTRYALMRKNKDNVELLCYIGTGSGTDANSTRPMWEMDKLMFQDFDPSLIVDHNLPEMKDRWAVVISPSTTWSNYRHQADAFAMYQLLRHFGYDDDHIVLIVEDNLAYNDKNVFPGEIYVLSGGDNVRKHAVVDYKFSNLTREDLCDIFLGKQSEHLPHVIHSTDQSNVFFFWSGHGGSQSGPLWGNEDARFGFGVERLQNLVQTMYNEKKYRRFMLAIETCYSGLWGEAITGIPDVIAITAANAYEPSKADVHDRQLGVFLSNAFARAFREAINANPQISIHDLYTRLANSTTGSHVTLYNEQNYGSVYSNDMGDYATRGF